MKNILQARLTKVNETTGEFWGIAAEESPDMKGEIFDYEASKPLIKAWSDDIHEHSGGKSFGNLRAQHNSKVAVGRLLNITFRDAQKQVEVHGEVVDSAELEKLAKGLYTGLSFGGDYGKKWRDGAGNIRYSAKPIELSLADKPAAATTRFTLVKVDGSEVEMEFQKAADAKSEGDYGAKADAGYADPGLQKDKKPRYPLKINGELNEKRIRAAWNYINKEKNAAAYADADLKKVKDAIVSAWREKIDKAGPPSAAEKVGQAGDLHKTLYQLATLAELLQSLQYLSEGLDWEAFYEMDDSPVANQLKTWLAQGGEILKAMTEEEIGELLEDLMTKTAEAGDLAKAGAEISAKNKDHIQQIHDHAAALGATCGGENMGKVAEAETLAKVAALEAEIQTKDEQLATLSAGLEEQKTELAKVSTGLQEKEAELAKVAEEKLALEKEVEKLQKEPVPAKGVLREGLSAPSKEEDGMEKAAAPEEPKTPLEAVKLAHQKPFIISGP
jgi:hypothetical protein